MYTSFAPHLSDMLSHGLSSLLISNNWFSSELPELFVLTTMEWVLQPWGCVFNSCYQ